MLVRTPRTLLEWQEVISGLLLQDVKSHIVVRFKTSRLTVTCEEPVAWTRDGENGGEHTTVELTNLQEEIEILTQWGDDSAADGVPSQE
jgi:diacylglycerol kinase family enzyme